MVNYFICQCFTKKVVLIYIMFVKLLFYKQYLQMRFTVYIVINKLFQIEIVSN